MLSTFPLTFYSLLSASHLPILRLDDARVREYLGALLGLHLPDTGLAVEAVLVTEDAGGLQFLGTRAALEAPLVISPAACWEALGVIDGLVAPRAQLLLHHHAESHCTKRDMSDRRDRRNRRDMREIIQFNRQSPSDPEYQKVSLGVAEQEPTCSVPCPVSCVVRTEDRRRSWEARHLLGCRPTQAWPGASPRILAFQPCSFQLSSAECRLGCFIIREIT